MRLQSSTLVVNLMQELAEAKEDINKEPKEMEVEFCHSLVDDLIISFWGHHFSLSHYEYLLWN